MKYKLICIDLDGTLLCDDKSITEENIQAIRSCTDIGVQVAISTGRISKFTKHIIKKLGVKVNIISANGGIIKDLDDKYISIHNLDYEEILNIKELLKDTDVDIYLNTEECIISEGSIYEDYTYKKINKKLDEEDRVEIIENYNLNDINNIYKDSIVKVVCINHQNINAAIESRKLLEESSKFEVTMPEKYFCEINKKGISKGKAVLELANYLGISTSEIICIGDSDNDTEMIKVAGLSIAMNNADKDVKDIADYITDSNNNSGVGKAIKKFVLKK